MLKIIDIYAPENLFERGQTFLEENKDTASDEEDDSIMKIYLDASMMVREIKCRTAFCYAVKKW